MVEIGMKSEMMGGDPSGIPTLYFVMRLPGDEYVCPAVDLLLHPNRFPHQKLGFQTTDQPQSSVFLLVQSGQPFSNARMSLQGYAIHFPRSARIFPYIGDRNTDIGD
jgi:hypothetical protein